MPRLSLRRPKKRVRRPRRKVTAKEAIDYLAITLFSKYAERLVGAFDLDKHLAEAGILTYPILYASRGLLYTTISVILAIYSIIVIALLPIALALKVILSILIGLTPLFAFVYMLIYPSAKKEERRNGVETELPFFAAYLTTMVRAGVPVAKVIERTAQLKIFKAIRRESQMIMRNITLLGKDPLDAIEENALDHPSPKYRDFMLGYVTSVRTGGDVMHYLEIRTQDIFTSRMNEMKMIAERMSMFTEIYVTLAVIMTLVFYIFFTIQAIFPVTPGGGVAQLALFSFVFLPFLTILLLWMIHSSQPKSPIEYKHPYRAMLTIGTPLALAIFIMTFTLTGAYKLLQGAEINYRTIMGLTVTLSGTLIALSLPPAIIHLGESRKTRKMGDSLAAFLRDLTEVRKTGLSPEKSILAVAQRSYGPLDPILRRIYTALTLGLELEKAVARAIRGYKDWLLLSNMRFLVDSISVGGGSPETLESLARYAYNLTELQKEFKKRLRSFIAMPYMGAVLVAASSMLVLGFTSKTLFLGETQGPMTIGGGSSISPQELAMVALLLSLGSILNSWLMGIVAGKIQDGKLAAGFLHGIILIIITLITIGVTLKGIQLTTPSTTTGITSVSSFLISLVKG